MKDAEAARDELGAVSVPVMFGFNRRFDPSFAAAHAQHGRDSRTHPAPRNV